MGAPAFTRGPWSWLFNGGFDGEASLMEGPEGDQGGSILEGVGFVRFEDAENRANANLIEAAPLLYEALMDAKYWIGPDDRMAPKLARKINAALAQARGEA